MTSRMALSSMSPVRKPQHPPSTPMKDPSSWQTSKKDINTNILGYLPCGQTRSSMTSRMTLSSMSPVRNPQCPPSTTMKALLETFLLKISTQNFQGTYLWVKQGHPWHQGWLCPPCLLSGTLNILQVPPWRTPHSWHTSNKGINTKLSWYLPLG